MSERNPFPSAEETLKHPAYPGVIWDLEPHQKGILPCAKDRGGPVDIAWEIHGDGPRKLIFIMGLAGLASSWQRQTKQFGHDQSAKYSVLLIDNRGIGLSSTPLQRYSTTQMAHDVLEVLNHLDWTHPRSLHLTGISLGGMISQELALLVPERIASLTILCSAATMNTMANLPSVLWERAGMLIPKKPEEAIADTARQIFTEEWLSAPDEAAEVPIPGTTHMCGVPSDGAAAYTAFDSNFQRFQAQELNKRLDKERFSATGFLLQLVAAAFHHKSPEQLRQLGDSVGRERIAVVHGTRDNMIDLSLGKLLMDGLKPSVALVLEGMGHAPVMERVAWFKEFLTERIEVGEEMNKREAA